MAIGRATGDVRLHAGGRGDGVHSAASTRISTPPAGDARHRRKWSGMNLKT